MARDEKNARPEELADVRTSSGPAEANAPVRPVGRVQQGDGQDAGDTQKEELDTEGKNPVIVNPALRGDAGVPYYDEDGNLQQEVFVAGKTHFVDDETKALKFGSVDMFVDVPEKTEE